MAVATNDPNPDTDPGQPHPFESLYRSAPGEKVLPSRPTLRHFEQHLSRPEGAQEGFGWLYREEVVEVEPVVVAEAEPQPLVPAAAAPTLRAQGSTPRPTRHSWLRVLVIVLLTLIGIGLGGMLMGWYPAWLSNTALTDLVRQAQGALARL